MKGIDLYSGIGGWTLGMKFSGLENIYSYEVEQAFLEIPYITEAAAYAVSADGGDGMEDEVMVALMANKDISINFVELLAQHDCAISFS